jgi:hypothetical protein
LLPTIIGVGISYFSGGTIDPKTAGMIVGGIETARTGDIGKGISAGLGAYGGASLGAGMAGAGADAMTTAGVGNYAETLAARGLEAGTPAYGEAASQLALESQQKALATPFADRLSEGANAVKDSPMKYLKANAKPLMYALGPAILAGESAEQNMPKTTTGMIRPYSFDPYSGTYTAANPYQATPTRAAGGGLMGMDDGGYSPGQLNFAERSEPVVRMADGGVPGYAAGSLVSDSQIFDYFKGLDQGQINSGALDAKIAADMQTYNVSAADIARATGTQANQGDYESRFVNAIATPGITADQFNAYTTDVGLTGQNLANALTSSGLSQSAQYALTHDLNDINTDYGNIRGTDFYKDLGYTQGVAPGDVGGLKGLYDNIDFATKGLQGQMAAGKLTGQEAREAALTEMGRIGVSAGDVKAATGKTITELFPDTITKLPPLVKTPQKHNITTAPTALPPGVSGAGTTTVNPNGTITTRPDLSLGMKTVRDDYVAGGGNLGYTPYTPQTIEEFDTKYGSRLTGGSKQSLDYLTGKTKYSPVPYTETGEIMKPYASSVLGIPTALSNRMYLFDPATKTYKINPDYAIPTYDKEGKKSLALTNQDVINYVKSPEYSNDDTFVSWMTANNLSPEQVAAATGMPISEVYKKIKKAKPVDAVVDTPVTGQNDGGGGGGDMADGGLAAMARGGMAQQFNLGDYSDGGRLLRGPGDGVSDSIPASIGGKRPARLADGEFVVPARIVSELGNGSTEAGARKLYAMMDRIQKARRGTVGRGRVAKNSRSEKYLPA